MVPVVMLDFGFGVWLDMGQVVALNYDVQVRVSVSYNNDII